MIGTMAMTTYFVKWNIMEIFPEMESSEILSIFTPLIGILPAVGMIIGLSVAPALIKRMEKRDLLIAGAIFSIVINILFYFLGYHNIYIFVFGRFIAAIPLGIFTSVTTLMFGDSVDEIEFRTGKRIEGTVFSLLTFITKFQTGISVALTGVILSLVGYIGTLDPNIAQQSDFTLTSIFVMVTLIPALGYLLVSIPFMFYDFTNSKHQNMLKEIKKRNNLV